MTSYLTSLIEFKGMSNGIGAGAWTDYNFFAKAFTSSEGFCAVTYFASGRANALNIRFAHVSLRRNKPFGRIV